MRDHFKVASLLAYLVVPAACVAECKVSAHDSGSSLNSVSSTTFEVASIRRDDPEMGGGMHMVRIVFLDDGFRSYHASIKTLIAYAYGLDEDEIEGGPAWLGTDSYEVEATFGESMAAELRRMDTAPRRLVERAMLRNLIEERFGLQGDCEDKIGPVYAMVVSKRGLKARPARAGDDYLQGLKNRDGTPAGRGFVGYTFFVGSVNIPAQAGTFAQLAGSLNANARSLYLNRKIIDSTGLPGAYDFELKFTVPLDRAHSGRQPTPRHRRVRRK